jgi:hypothetical protein
MRRRAWGSSIQIWLGLVSLGFPSLGAATPAHAATPCPTAQASSAMPYAHAATVGGDEGVQATGFITLPSGETAVNGIDVSKTKGDADFQAAYACGARFAYIQLSVGTSALDHTYRIFWPNARSAGLIAGPSHGLVIDSASLQRWSGAAAEARPAILQSLVAAAAADGASQSALFLSRLHEVIATEPPPAAGAPVGSPPIVLDMTADPLPTGAAADKTALGPVYAAEACAFLAAVRADPGTYQAPVMLFTDPKLWAAYGLVRNACGLELLPVWIAYHAMDGGRFDGSAAAADQGVVTALCRPGGSADRCVMQQYSSAGSFAVFKAGAHLDLDRWFGSLAAFTSALAAYR